MATMSPTMNTYGATNEMLRINTVVIPAGGASPFFFSAEPPALTPANVDPSHASSAVHPLHWLTCE